MEALLGDMERPHVPAVSGGFIQSVPEVQAEIHEIHLVFFLGMFSSCLISSPHYFITMLG